MNKREIILAKKAISAREVRNQLKVIVILLIAIDLAINNNNH
jgi:hypothetical protein